MLETIVYNEKGDAYLNSLRRFVMSGLLVPTQENLVINVPAASAVLPGVSNYIPLQGPGDAKSEIFSAVGVQGVVNVGIGTVTTNGSTALVGIGTIFAQQLQPGSQIVVAGSGTYTIASIQSNTAATLTGVAGAAVGAVWTFTVPIIAAVQNNLACLIEDSGHRRLLMNAPVPVLHMFGTAQKPGFLRESLLLEVDQTMRMQLYNYSAAGPGSLAPQFEFRKWQIESLKRPDVGVFIEALRQRKTYLQPYWLTLDNGYVDVAAGGSTTAFFTITGDITVVLFDALGHAISTGQAGDVQEMFSTQIFGPRQQWQFQSQPFTLNTGWGTASNPMRLPTPITAEPGSQIKIVIQNLITDQPTRVFLTFHGVAFYTGLGGSGGALTTPSLLTAAQQMYRATTTQIAAAGPQG